MDLSEPCTLPASPLDLIFLPFLSLLLSNVSPFQLFSADFEKRKLFAYFSAGMAEFFYHFPFDFVFFFQFFSQFLEMF